MLSESTANQYFLSHQMRSKEFLETQLRGFGVPKSAIGWAAQTLVKSLASYETIDNVFAELPQGKFRGVVACTGSRIIVARKQTRRMTDSYPFTTVAKIIADVESYTLRINLKSGEELVFRGAFPIANADLFADYVSKRIRGQDPKVARDMSLHPPQIQKFAEVNEKLGTFGIEFSDAPKIRKMLTEAIHLNETIESVASGVSHYAVVTNSRILLLEPSSFLSKEETTAIPLSSVVYVSGKVGRLYGDIEIKSRNGTKSKVRMVFPKQVAPLFELVAKSQRFGFDQPDTLPTNMMRDYVADRFKTFRIRGRTLERRVLAWILAPNEPVIIMAAGDYGPLIGTRPTIVACTDRRLIVLNGETMPSGYGEIALSAITSVNYMPGAIDGFTVTLGSRALLEFTNLSNPNLTEMFADTLSELVGQLAPIEADESSALGTRGGDASIADELIKLKGLLDAGAIDQAEFDALKASLIASAR